MISHVRHALLDAGLADLNLSDVLVDRLAAAAMRAMREPSEAMIDAAIASTAVRLTLPGSALTVNREKMRIRYRAMFDRALASPIDPTPSPHLDEDSMQEIVAFKARDGQLFETRQHCLAHEARLDLNAFFADVGRGDGWDADMVVRLVLDSPTTLRDILDAVLTTDPVPPRC